MVLKKIILCFALLMSVTGFFSTAEAEQSEAIQKILELLQNRSVITAKCLDRPFSVFRGYSPALSGGFFWQQQSFPAQSCRSNLTQHL